MRELHYLQTKIADGIGIMTLHNPPANFLPIDLIEELDEVLHRFSADSVRVAIVTGGPRVFSTGFDPARLADISSASYAQEISRLGQEVLLKLERQKKPFLAAINGLCLGGGLELAMACHLRFCSSKARLGLPETTLGVIPGLGGTQRLPRLVGVPTALRLILTGDSVTAQEARAIGLVDVVVPSGRVLAKAIAFAKRVGQRDPEVTAAVLESVCHSYPQDSAQGYVQEAQAFGRLCARRGKAQPIADLLS